MYHDSSRRTRTVWILRIGFALAFLLLHSPAFAQGNSKAASPVGAWDTEVFQGGESAFRALTVINFGGTMLNTPAVDPLITAYGSWKKVGENRYQSSFYILGIDGAGNHTGYVKGEAEFSMVGKDRQEGVNKLFFLVGLDPLSPDAVIPLVEETFIRKRLTP
jgi:hypothetical protein